MLGGQYVRREGGMSRLTRSVSCSMCAIVRVHISHLEETRDARSHATPIMPGGDAPLLTAWSAAARAPAIGADQGASRLYCVHSNKHLNYLERCGTLRWWGLRVRCDTSRKQECKYNRK